MPAWRDIAAFLENQFDSLKALLNERLGKSGPVHILPYRGHGTPNLLHLRGRVLEDKGLEPSTDEDVLWTNILSAYRRFESDELPGVRLRARFQDTVQEVVTDEEGYFEVRLHPSKPLPADRTWHEVHLESISPIPGEQESVQATGRVLVPPPSSSFGVISDIDDTILLTNATNLLKMARLTILRNARGRLPFPGVATFYEALRLGPDGQDDNPFFYVSSSPWNLYDFLTDFMGVYGLPEGPLFLRDLGLQWITTTDESRHMRHKGGRIEHLLTAYPDLPFVLIGDSGQHDPEIYEQIATDFPDRILAVYIRDVSPETRDLAIERMAETLHSLDIPMQRVRDSLHAAENAAEQGLLSPDLLPAIRDDVASDEEPDPLEELLDAEDERPDA